MPIHAGSAWRKEWRGPGKSSAVLLAGPRRLRYNPASLKAGMPGPKGPLSDRCETTDPHFESMPLSREHILEAALLTAKKPVSVRELRRLFDDELSHADVLKLLDSLSAFWQGRGLRLREVAGGWRMETAPEATPYLFKLKDEDRPKRFTRAALETLAVIAYRQPVTRGDIEEIRGVSLSPGTLRMFEERGWIETVGWRETPGRPALLGTTRQFLEDFGLKSLEDLPVPESAENAPFDLSSTRKEVEGTSESLFAPQGLTLVLETEGSKS